VADGSSLEHRRGCVFMAHPEQLSTAGLQSCHFHARKTTDETVWYQPVPMQNLRRGALLGPLHAYTVRPDLMNRGAPPDSF